MSDRAVSLFEQLVQRVTKQVVIPGTVKSVDLAGLTCSVKPDDGGAELPKVRLRPVRDGLDTGLLLVPVEGSAVVVLMLDPDTGLLISTSTVQLYSIRTQDESLKDVLNDLLETLEQLTVTTPSGPSGVPINRPALTAIKARLNNLFHS